MPRPARSIKAKALALIAQREHSRLELRRKLLAHIERQARKAEAEALPAAGALPALDAPATEMPSAPAVAAMGEPQVEELLDWLVSRDLVSAERFVETRVAARTARFGNLRIRHELAQHGLQLDADAQAGLQASELPRAHAVWAKRFGKPAADAAGRAKQMRFLSARGFSAEVVRRVVKGEAGD